MTALYRFYVLYNVKADQVAGIKADVGDGIPRMCLPIFDTKTEALDFADKFPDAVREDFCTLSFVYDKDEIHKKVDNNEEE